MGVISNKVRECVYVGEVREENQTEIKEGGAKPSARLPDLWGIALLLIKLRQIKLFSSNDYVTRRITGPRKGWTRRDSHSSPQLFIVP